MGELPEPPAQPLTFAIRHYASERLSQEFRKFTHWPKPEELSIALANVYAKAMDNSSGFGQWVNFLNPRLSRSLSQYDITHNFVASYIYAMPFDRAFGKLPKRLTQGWALNGVTRYSGGLPVSLRQGGDYSLVGGIARNAVEGDR